MAEASSEFLVPIDVDEFLVLWKGNAISTDSKDIHNHFRFVPRDGRRYRMASISTMECPTRTFQDDAQSFRRTHRMTTFIMPGNRLTCMSKTFYFRQSFVRTDQGNHGGTVTTDSQDKTKGYTVGRCPYYHSPNLALIHYGSYLPWEIQNKKMMRGAVVYNHTGKVDAGMPCGEMGVHYCWWYQKIIQQGETNLRNEYEARIPCNRTDLFSSQAIKIVIQQEEMGIGVVNHHTEKRPLNDMSGVEKVFIVGTSHSGTSILERIMGNIPSLTALCRETEMFLGKPFKPLDPTDSVLLKLADDFDSDAVKRGAKFWIEKTPRHIFFISRILEMFPKSYFVWITRDPIQVAISLRKRGLGVHCKGSFSGCGEYWTKGNEHAFYHLSNVPRVFRLKFEHLYSRDHVFDVLQDIFALLDIDVPVTSSLLQSARRQASRNCYRFTSEREKERILFQEAVSKSMNSFQNAVDPKNHDIYRAIQMSSDWNQAKPYNVSVLDSLEILRSNRTRSLARRLGYNYPSVIFQAERLSGSPLLDQDNTGFENMNGVTVIKTEPWMVFNVSYIMYFAGHVGKEIRIAGSNSGQGPWKMLGAVVLEGFHAAWSHIASPDIYIDKPATTVRLYFHAATREGQWTYVAISRDGVTFCMHSMAKIAPFYLRVFVIDGTFYGLAKIGNNSTAILHSSDGLTEFKQGPLILPNSRHTSVLLKNGSVHIFYTIVDEAPERIYHTEVMNPQADWTTWYVGIGVPILEPELPFEGVEMPLVPSEFGPAPGLVRQLRDPYIFEDDEDIVLFYVAGGERSISIARLLVSTE
ncbi:R118 [Picochlorum sp. SENEW3]|nr:R118 [Picochlorum sp. SENEW3]